MWRTTSIKGLTTTVSIADGLDLRALQVGTALIDCEVIDGQMTVKAPHGILFAAGGVMISLPDNWTVTDYCDTAALAKQLDDEQAERLTDAQLRRREAAACERAVYSGVREFVAAA